MIISLYTLLTAVADSFANQMKGLMHQENVDIVIQSKFSTTPLSSSINIFEILFLYLFIILIELSFEFPSIIMYSILI